MTKVCFIEIDGVIRDNDGEAIQDMIELVDIISQYYTVFAFSVARESNRLELEQWLIDNELQIEEVLLRAENDYSKNVDLRVSFVLDHFHGDELKAVDNTAFIVCNSEMAAERYRELGLRVLSSDWGM